MSPMAAANASTERSATAGSALGMDARRPPASPKARGDGSRRQTAQQETQGGLAVSKERRLGRGLEALLGRAWDDSDQTPAAAGSSIEAAGDSRVTRDDNGQVW